MAGSVNRGAGWIVYEDDADFGSPCRLLSLLAAHRSVASIARHTEQLYVDRYGTIEERFAYKRRPQDSRYAAKTDPRHGGIYVGQSPRFVGVYAQRIVTHAGVLEFWYRIATERGAPGPVLECRMLRLPL
ncbi:hypothetical protein [Lysobacter arvi]|uniref:RES domain-containing protein n=1 Tax=Lysobacter arvi TaxID=3038776 RepID=A0ABU1CE32_9GAMM|nr:hypothetical protein [Lysobacter arvi]MDR0183439.1 hypothetical protein [Lysobacter arvi]